MCKDGRVGMIKEYCGSKRVRKRKCPTGGAKGAPMARWALFPQSSLPAEIEKFNKTIVCVCIYPFCVYLLKN